jgi:phage tail-like protein
MAVQRDNPYAGFNFLVDLGDGDPTAVVAGFMEVSGLGMAVSVIEYRNGNDKSNALRKLPGLTKTPEVRLCRGVIGSTGLFAWLQAVANGRQDYRDIVVQLLSEEHSQVAQSWKLVQAIPVSYSGPIFSAVRNAVAIEELVLACQSISVE